MSQRDANTLKRRTQLQHHHQTDFGCVHYKPRQNLTTPQQARLLCIWCGINQTQFWWRCWSRDIFFFTCASLVPHHFTAQLTALVNIPLNQKIANNVQSNVSRCHFLDPEKIRIPVVSKSQTLLQSRIAHILFLRLLTTIS